MECVSESKEHPDGLNKYLPFIKRILRKRNFPFKRTAKASFYLTVAVNQLITDFLVYSSDDDSFGENGILTLYNVVHAIENGEELASFVKKLGIRLPKNLEKDDGIICEEEKETSKQIDGKKSAESSETDKKE